jgi:hypothetical protein
MMVYELVKPDYMHSTRPEDLLEILRNVAVIASKISSRNIANTAVIQSLYVATFEIKAAT